MSYIGSTPTTQSFIAGTDSFNGTGSATNFTLSRFVNSVNDIQVVVNNVVQYPPNYSVSGNTLTISPAPSSGTNNVYVRYLSTTLQSITVPGGSTVNGTFQVAQDTYLATSSGGVGVGTISPDSLSNFKFVDVGSSATNQGVLQANNGTVKAAIYVNGTNGNVSTRTNHNLNIQTNGTTRATFDTSGNVGVNNTSPAQYATSGKVVNITGTANNSGPANLFMPGSSTQTGAGYASTEVFAVSSITSATEITRVTGTSTNGFRAYFKVIVTGHTGAVGNGINIKEYFWDGGTGGATQISTYTNGQVPGITITNSTNYVLIINLSSSDGVNGFNGVMKVEWMLPIDFAASTYTIS